MKKHKSQVENGFSGPYEIDNFGDENAEVTNSGERVQNHNNFGAKGKSLK